MALEGVCEAIREDATLAPHLRLPRRRNLTRFRCYFLHRFYALSVSYAWTKTLQTRVQGPNESLETHLFLPVGQSGAHEWTAVWIDLRVWMRLFGQGVHQAF